MRMKFAAALVALLSLSSPCFAQTPPATTTPGTGAADKVAVPIWPVSTVALPEQAVPASFSLGQIEGVDPALLSGVTAKGFARKVAVENQSIGQILVMSVAKGEREETISTEGLTAQFDAKDTNQLFPEKTMEVSGSKSALVAALERLAAPKADDKEKREIKDDVSENPASGSGDNNSEAAGYKTPTVTAAPATEEKEPVTEYRNNTAECPVRIDLVQETAFQQSKVQTFTDGALTNDGECTDGAASYPLKKSYPSCPIDIVDIANMKAWPQFQWYYIDDAGENHPVGECQKDEETVYTVTEDEAECPIYLDFVDNKAVPQAALVYINRNNAKTQARGCENSTKSAALTMTENPANCPLRHDYAGGRSYELSMWTYLRDGVTYQAAPCTDTGRSFQHEKIYLDAGGNNICPAITNLTTKTAIQQYRISITVDGVPQFVGECAPDTTTSSILSTTDDCMDPSKWTHDLAANISYGQERFYYLKTNGQREYVTTCKTSSVSYPHSVTITGYQNHDDQLWAYPLTTVTISVNGAPYTIASSDVLPGAPQMVYLPNGTVDQATGISTYDGCKAYRETAKYERWQRPDNSEYLKQIGTGTPTGPVDVCISNVVKSSSVRLTNWCWHSGGSTFNPLIFGHYDHYISKTEKKNTETGQVIAITCAESNTASFQDGNNGGGDQWPQFCNHSSVPEPYRGANCVNGMCQFWAPGYPKAKQQWSNYVQELGVGCPTGF
ncbi:protein of unknown function [Magnetospirillum gryphiswaldense MSR-1 v2]|uniref:Secreted protein n=1 Tax=Magnetospirillum gryphiswaldense (strain DSM 6361 / JCM 21280 / NBRC 15271 / MSR-1) TaxID=431944 RepID=V6F0X7_MAGGM|nr:hypothetical protein [Magnetospirillum gryphiswaldense]CDK99160.1 protein of unknown function [Magnetospirillum gryphiswaldense MSR-1 v2]